MLSTYPAISTVSVSSAYHMEMSARTRTFKFFSGAPLAWVGLSYVQYTYVKSQCIYTCPLLFTAAGLLPAFMNLYRPSPWLSGKQLSAVLNLSLLVFK